MNPIVGIGEILWDVYPDGRKVAGGAPFNFAFHCHQLGHPAVIVSRVGDDDLGRELRDRVRELGLSDEYIQTDYEHPTGTVRVKLDANKVATYTIAENVAWDYIAWEPHLTFLREFAHTVAYGTLAQRYTESADCIYEFVTHTGADLRVMDVNLRQTTWRTPGMKAYFDRAKWIKLNIDEARIIAEGWGMLLTDQTIDIKKMVTLFRMNTLIVTHGEQGCEIVESYGNKHFTEPGVPANVLDTVGAGDAFTAAMVCQHLEGKPLRECARFANHYAARVCEHEGGTPRIDRYEVERAAGLR